MKKYSTEDTRAQWSLRKYHSRILAACLNRRADEYFATGNPAHDSYKRRAGRVYPCSDRIEEQRYDNGDATHRSWFLCGDRLCPQCARVRSVRLAVNALGVQRAYYKAHPDAPKPIHVVLTQRNCLPCELKGEIGRMLDALRLITHRRRDIKRLLAGMARSIEVTYNAESRTYHPHVHLIVLPKSEDAAQALLSDSWWRQVWQDCMRLDYVPMCDAKECYSDGAMAEVTKYITKMMPIYSLESSDLRYAVLSCIDDAIRDRRVIAYYGEWRKLRAALKQDDNLEPVEDEEHTVVHRELLEWAGLEAGYVPVKVLEGC